MQQIRPKTIRLVDFQEEPLASGRKMLHCIFQDNYGAHYKWTPQWKGEHGVECLFFRALATEEYNEPEGVWTSELKKAAESIPPLEAMQLPVKIHLGGMTDVGNQHVLRIEILSMDESVSYDSDTRTFYIGSCGVRYDALKDFLLQACTVAGIEGCECIYGGRVFEGSFSYSEQVGIALYVRLEKWNERQRYEVAARELASNIRLYLRRILLDFRALKQGFEES
ncbi:MAG: hypothetical protein HY680_04445 [Chloroflexi bacterium]|nr:hypothetical protein [Chloroflexota bacterium]